MRVVRGLVLTVVALIGLALGAVVFLALGLFVVQPPTIGGAAPRQNYDVIVDMTEAFLTEQIGKDTSGDKPVQISNAKVVMKADGTVTITGKVGGTGNTGGARPSSAPALPINPANLSVDVEMVMKPTANQDGKLTVQVVSARFGPVPVPGQLGRLLENPINNQIAKTMNNQPFAIISLVVRDGGMTVQVRQVP